MSEPGRSEFRFYGASDDLLEVEDAVDDEIDSPRGEVEVKLEHPGGEALIVSARYTLRGSWLLGVCQVDEDYGLPDWPITIRPAAPGESDYSVTLVVDAPEGTLLSNEGRPS